MQARKPISLILLGFILCVPVSGLLAFFLAGAVAFPIVEPYYASRVLLSFGFMALVYGAECVWNWGSIETCGLLSGNCTTHNLYFYAIQIWYVLVILSLLILIGLLLRARKAKSQPAE